MRDGAAGDRAEAEHGAGQLTAAGADQAVETDYLAGTHPRLIPSWP